MALDLIQGGALALFGGAVSGALTLWRGAAVTDTKLGDLKEEFSKHETENGRVTLELNGELRGYVTALHEVTMEFKISLTQQAAAAREQSAFNHICTKTLEGLSNKLEFHHQTLVLHDKELALAKERIHNLQKQLEAIKGGGQ